MEHREPPRIAAGDRRFDGAIENPASEFRLRAFDPFSSRPRIDAFRLRACRRWRRSPSPAMLVYLGSTRRAQPCVAASPIAVPTCVRSDRVGSRASDAGIAAGSEIFSLGCGRVRGMRNGSLSSRFGPIGWRWRSSSIHGWRKWSRCSYAPGRISVDLKFREPVAWVKLADGRTAARRWRRAGSCRPKTSMSSRSGR